MRLPNYCFRFVLIGCMTFLYPNLVNAKTVTSLDEIPNAIKTPEGKALYAEQMSGITRNLPFGQLPEGINVQDFVKWIGPNEDNRFLTVTGAKPWGKEGLYVAAACFAWDEKNALMI